MRPNDFEPLYIFLQLSELPSMPVVHFHFRIKRLVPKGFFVGRIPVSTMLSWRHFKGIHEVLYVAPVYHLLSVYVFHWCVRRWLVQWLAVNYTSPVFVLMGRDTRKCWMNVQLKIMGTWL